MINLGQAAPDFTLPTDEGSILTLSQFRGQKVILYFYPKDDTPGCTQEACDFRDAYALFEAAKCIIIGISKDSPKSHKKFKDKYNLPFYLASDETTKVCQMYGVWGEKKLYGKTYMGVERATFLIDERGQIMAAWRNVKVPNHVQTILETCREPLPA